MMPCSVDPFLLIVSRLRPVLLTAVYRPVEEGPDA